MWATTTAAVAPKRLRLLYVCHVSELGGAEASLLDLLHGAQRAENTAFVALPHMGSLALEAQRTGASVLFCSALGRVRRRAGVRTAARILAGQFQLRRAAREHAIDLVHANSATAALFSLGVQPPLVWHARDLAIGRETAWLARRAARCIAPSQACAEAVRARAPRACVTVVENGIHLARFARVRKDETSRNRMPLLLAVGHLFPWKGHQTLLAAVRRVRDAGVQVELAIVGGDPFGDEAAALRELQRSVAEYGLERAVQIVGRSAHVEAWLSRADLMVHAAYPEPFGRAVVESMAAGVPVIAFAGAHGPAEILRNGRGGWLVRERSAAALARAILVALSNPAALHAQGEQARVEATRYDRERMTTQVNELYFDVLQQGRKRQTT